MRLRSALGTVVLTLVLGTVAPAAHAQYPPTVGAGRVTRSDMKQCQCTQFSGDGFAPGSTVVVVDRGPDGIERPVGTTTADSKGEFKFKVCLDEKAPQGEHTLIARGSAPSGLPREVRANVRLDGSVCYRKGDEIHNPNVIDGDEDEQPDTGNNGTGNDGDGDGNGSVGPGKLPRTGAEYVIPGLLLGFTLVLTGTGLVHLTRRRRLVTG